MLREKHLINKVIVQSFDWEYLRAFHEEEPRQILAALGPPTLIASGKGRAEGAVDGGQDGPELAGLPIGVPGKDSDKPLDPKKVAQQAQRLSYPQRLALPAVLSNARSQERTIKELENDKGPKPAATPKRDPQEDLSIIPTKEGFLQVAVKEVEHKIVTRDAMKAPPAKSALQGEVNVTQSAEVAKVVKFLCTEAPFAMTGSAVEMFA